MRDTGSGEGTGGWISFLFELYETIDPRKHLSLDLGLVEPVEPGENYTRARMDKSVCVGCWLLPFFLAGKSKIQLQLLTRYVLPPCVIKISAVFGSFTRAVCNCFPRLCFKSL